MSAQTFPPPTRIITIRRKKWRVMTSPDPLFTACCHNIQSAVVDHADLIIWMNPELTPAERAEHEEGIIGRLGRYRS